MTNLLISFLSGALITGIIAWLFQRSGSGNQRMALASLEFENKKLQDEKLQLLERATKAEGKNEILEEQYNTIGQNFKFEFRNLAQTIMEEKTQKFTELNEEKMKAILDPLKSEIGKFKTKVEDTYDKESKERFSLG